MWSTIVKIKGKFTSCAFRCRKETAMKKKIKNKILVPVYGSDRALHTVRHIVRNDQFHKMDIILFHVSSSVPEGYRDLEKDP